MQVYAFSHFAMEEMLMYSILFLVFVLIILILYILGRFVFRWRILNRDQSKSFFVNVFKLDASFLETRRVARSRISNVPKPPSYTDTVIELAVCPPNYLYIVNTYLNLIKRV